MASSSSKSTAGTGFTVTRKNRRNNPDRMVMKYDPVVRKRRFPRGALNPWQKKSKIAKNEQRKVIVERYAAKRAELKKTLVDENATPGLY